MKGMEIVTANYWKRSGPGPCGKGGDWRHYFQNPKIRYLTDKDEEQIIGIKNKAQMRIFTIYYLKCS